MPVWRPRRDWLDAAVRSALADGAVSELVVVDDGCPTPVDGLLAVSDPRVRVVRADHGGPSAARNAGLAVAAGDWIRFVDADDVVVAGSTARMLARADGASAIVHAATVVCDEELRPSHTIASLLEGDVARACVLGAFEVRVVSMLFPHVVVDAAGPWDTSFDVSGDWDFVLRCVERSPVVRDAGVAAYYRRNDASVSRAASVGAGEAARARIVDGFVERHPEERGGPVERAARAEALAGAARGFASRGAVAHAAGRWVRLAETERRPRVRLALELARLAAARTRS
jgi:succinoglycan biosynthesis protein ExoO